MLPDTDRQRHVKDHAGQMATGLNDVAAEASAASAIYGLVGLVPAAAAYGIFSGICWYLGNRYAEISSDPPRDDFTVVSIPHVPRTWRCCRPQFGADERLYDSTDKFLVLGSSLFELRTALERYQGAQAANDNRHAEVQLEAARFAAVTSSELQDEILRTAPLINLSWHESLDQAGAFEPGYTVDVTAARESYPRFFEMGWQVLQTAYIPATLDWERLKPPGEHPVFADGWEPVIPPRIINDTLLDDLETTAADLRGLIIPSR